MAGYICRNHYRFSLPSNYSAGRSKIHDSPKSKNDKCPPAKGWYENIVLTNIDQTNVELNEYGYIGIIVGDPEFAMENVTFDNVSVMYKHSKIMKNGEKDKNVKPHYVTKLGGIKNGIFIDSKPVPIGFASQTTTTVASRKRKLVVDEGNSS